MTGVGDRDKAVIVNARGERGREPFSHPAEETVVEPPQNENRVVSFFGGGANRADQQGDQHGGGKALAGNVANHDEQAALARGKDLEEIAADLASRLVDRFHGIAGKGLARAQEESVAGSRGRRPFHFRAKPFLSACAHSACLR